MIGRLLVLWLALLWPVAAQTAATVGTDESKVIYPKASSASAPTPDAGGAIGLSTVLGALALAAGGVWFLVRSRAAKTTVRLGQALAVEETKSLGNRQFLVVASYEGQKFLLGVVPGRIDFLSALKGKDGAQNISG